MCANHKPNKQESPINYARLVYVIDSQMYYYLIYIILCRVYFFLINFKLPRCYQQFKSISIKQQIPIQIPIKHFEMDDIEALKRTTSYLCDEIRSLRKQLSDDRKEKWRSRNVTRSEALKLLGIKWPDSDSNSDFEYDSKRTRLSTLRPTRDRLAVRKVCICYFVFSERECLDLLCIF